MTEYIFKGLVDVSPTTERRAWAILLKVLFYTNCGIITIWIAHMVGYPIDRKYFEVGSWPSLVTGYHVLVPLFIFIFTSVCIRTLTSIASSLSLWFFKKLRRHVFEERTLAEYLIEEKVIHDNCQPAENYLGALEQVKRRARNIEKGKVIVDYYISLMISIVFLYNTVIESELANMYFPVINVVLSFYLFFLLVAGGVPLFYKLAAQQTLALLHASPIKVRNGKQIPWSDVLGLQFPKPVTANRDK